MQVWYFGNAVTTKTCTIGNYLIASIRSTNLNTKPTITGAEYIDYVQATQPTTMTAYRYKITSTTVTTKNTINDNAFYAVEISG